MTLSKPSASLCAPETLRDPRTEPTRAPWLLSALALTLGTAWAQAPDMRSQRERTRATVEAVQSDQPGQLDTARSFGTTLRPQPQAAASSAVVVADPPPLPPLPPLSPLTDAAQWPPLRPRELRVVPRASAASAPGRPEPDNARPVFTPDFSRQRLTLGALVGRPVVDLPTQELVDITPQATPTQSSAEESTALGLPDLVNLGLDYSPVMQQVLAQLDAQVNRVKRARADLLPRASARFSTGREVSEGDNVVGTPNRHRNSSSSLRLTQPLINLPLAADWLAELSSERAAYWRLQAARESVSLAVTQAVVNVATARVVMDHSDEQLASFVRLLEHVQARAQSGATSAADLERTRTRVLLARQVRIEQQTSYNNARLELQRLTGQSPQALRLPYLNQLPGLPTTQAELRRLVFDNSHELHALRADIEAQRGLLLSQRSAALPVLGLSLERDEGRNVRGTNPTQVDTRAMAVLSWDFSLGGKEIYGARSAAAELANREARLTEQGERVMQAIDADFAALQSATLRLAAGQAEQLAASAVVTSVNEQLRVGRLGSLLEALDAYERQFAARQRLTQTLGQQMQAQAQLLSRLGALSAMKELAQVEPGPAQPASPPKLSTTPSP